MTTVRRISVSQVRGEDSNSTNTDEIRPYGDIGLYEDNNGKLELLIADGGRTNVRNKVLNKGTFYGGDSDSGDGAGLDTIKLVPDEVIRRNGSDQYIIIDPTEPDHIHVRAGGTIDNSSADLFLGGEKNHVRVSDGGNTVSISTDAGEGDTNIWVFNSSGNLTFPDSTVQVTAYVAPVIDTTSGTTSTLADDEYGTLDLTGGRAYVLYKIQTSAAAWVRIYINSSSRTADASRAQGVDPTTNSGVIAEAITTGAQTVVYAPAVNGFNDENPTTDAMPIAVTNLSGGNAAITVTVTKMTVVA